MNDTFETLDEGKMNLIRIKGMNIEWLNEYDTWMIFVWIIDSSTDILCKCGCKWDWE